MQGKMDKIMSMIKEYPDTALRRKILTDLGDINEMLNGHLIGLAGIQGYVFDAEEKVARAKQ